MRFFSKLFAAGLAALALAWAPAAPAGINHGGGGGGGDPALPGYTIVHMASTAAAWTGTIAMESGYPIDNGASGIDIQDSFAGGRHLAYTDYTSAAEMQQFVTTFTPKDSGRYVYAAIVRGDTFAVYGVIVDLSTCTQTEAHSSTSPAPTSPGSQVDHLVNGRCRISVYMQMPASAGSEVFVAISDQGTGGGSSGYVSDSPSFTGNATHTITVFPSGT